MKALWAAMLTVALAACASTFALTCPSSVRVLVDAGWGSGVVISGNRVLTAAHVTEHSDGTVTVLTRDSERYEAEVIWQGEPLTKHDTAILRVDTGMPAAEVYCGPLHVGQKVFHMAYPAVSRHAMRLLTQGYISTLDIGDTRIFAHTVGLDLTAGPGGSGGPVYDSEGRVIGLLVGGVPYGIGGVAFMVRPPERVCN